MIEENKKKKGIVHVVALTEVWIYENENKYYNLPNYNAYFANRELNRAGGCILFVHESICSSQVSCKEFEKVVF